MKKIISLMAILVLFAVIACTPYHHEGAAVGGAMGGMAGAMLDHKNPWRGGIIGAAIGAIVGATIVDISQQAAMEAASTGRPVEYRTVNGRGVYRADPIGYNEITRCRTIHEKVWEDGYLVQDQVREVCEGPRYDNYDRHERHERRY